MMISDLRSATSESAATDLPLAENVLLSPGRGIYKLKTNQGAIPKDRSLAGKNKTPPGLCHPCGKGFH